MFSIIICSISPERLSRLKENIEETIGVEHEIIAFDNRELKWPIAKVYNEGARRARHPYLFFVHEDVRFHTLGWGEVIAGKLKEPDCGVIGFAGSKIKLKTYTGWGTKGEYSHVLMYQGGLGKTLLMVSHIYPDEPFSEVITLDGLGMFVAKAVWEQYPFDEKMLTGFHCYDLDFSLQIATSSRYKNFISTDDLDDIFIESAVTLMDRVKAGKYKLDKGSLFSYFVMIGWGNIMNLIRSRSTKAKTGTIGAGGETTVKASLIPRKTDLASEKNASQEAPYAEDVETEQNAQEKLIDEIFMSLPEKCQRILKLFYWDKKPMDEIAPLVGSKNADTVKAQKSNCMKKAKDIFSSQDPELVETAMGRAAQRAMLSSFIRDRLEMETSEDSGRLAAYSFGNKDVYVYGPEDLDTPLQEIDDLEE